MSPVRIDADSLVVSLITVDNFNNFVKLNSLVISRNSIYLTQLCKNTVNDYTYSRVPW